MLNIEFTTAFYTVPFKRLKYSWNTTAQKHPPIVTFFHEFSVHKLHIITGKLCISTAFRKTRFTRTDQPEMFTNDANPNNARKQTERQKINVGRRKAVRTTQRAQFICVTNTYTGDM